MFEIDQNARRLSDEEKEQYIKEGYVTGLPVFSENAVDDLHDWYEELSSKLPKDIDINKIQNKMIVIPEISCSLLISGDATAP